MKFFVFSFLVLAFASKLDVAEGRTGFYEAFRSTRLVLTWETFKIMCRRFVRPIPTEAKMRTWFDEIKDDPESNAITLGVLVDFCRNHGEHELVIALFEAAALRRQSKTTALLAAPSSAPDADKKSDNNARMPEVAGSSTFSDFGYTLDSDRFKTMCEDLDVNESPRYPEYFKAIAGEDPEITETKFNEFREKNPGHVLTNKVQVAQVREVFGKYNYVEEITSKEFLGLYRLYLPKTKLSPKAIDVIFVEIQQSGKPGTKPRSLPLSVFEAFCLNHPDNDLTKAILAKG